FDSARLLAKSGYYSEACPKFEQSLRLNPGIGTEFNLADCLDRIGQTERARDLFLDVADKARAAGQADRQEAARERAAALAPAPVTTEPGDAPAIVIVGTGSEVATNAEPEPGCADASTAVLREEYGSLAEAAAGVRALKQSAAQLAAIAPSDPRLQKARRDLVELEAQLAAAWSLAGHVATALASRSAGSPDERSAKPRESTPGSPPAGSVAVASAPGHRAQ
ncbi:MAG TPA: hypothetical protein VNW92_23355, partial [Polyangiaceae bacterium]|nr:hypothetical protein [Polyangiaceae bacterium]